MSQMYKESGVDIAAGNKASSLAAAAAKATFASRNGKIGMPVDLPGGFAGLLDFGEFYLVQCCDTVGTKIDLAEQEDSFEGLGDDLLAMVADDAICVGAEVVSITNTFETKSIIPEQIGVMMESLKNACIKQKIVIAGGEIAEVGPKVSGTSWGADAVGIVAKDRVLTGAKVQAGDAIIALKEHGFRCNGFSLVRKVLADHPHLSESIAQAALRPSILYHNAVLAVMGRYGETKQNPLTGVAHITGGGIPGNIRRILKHNKLGAKLTNLFTPCAEMLQIQQAANIPQKELYEVFNCGNGMLLTCNPEDANGVIETLQQNGVEAQIAGEVVAEKMITIESSDHATISYEY